MDEYTLKFPCIYFDFELDEIFCSVVNMIKKIDLVDRGHLSIDLYSNSSYGTVVSICMDDMDSLCVDASVTVHLDSIFLYEMEYFDVRYIDGSGTLYYYNSKYYVSICDSGNMDTLCEYSDLIYGDKVLDIVNDGIKVFVGIFKDIP